jgi:hypothetical protein
LPLQHARAHDSGVFRVDASIRCGGLMLVLTVSECSNALKHNHVASWHRTFAIAHERRYMGRNGERCGSLELAPNRGEVSCGSHVREEVTDRSWVHDDEWSVLGCKKCSGDGDDCDGWRLASTGGDEEVGAGEASRRLLQPRCVGVLGDLDLFRP